MGLWTHASYDSIRTCKSSLSMLQDKTHNRDLSAEVIPDLTILDGIRGVFIDHGGKLCKKSISPYLKVRGLSGARLMPIVTTVVVELCDGNKLMDISVVS